MLPARGKAATGTFTFPSICVILKSMLKNILLVDDDEDDREFFLQVLNGLRRDVYCVSAINGRDGPRKIGRLPA